jgi:hypothetical protein
MPRANKNCCLFSTPKTLRNLKVEFKIALVSIISGFISTAINGIIEATPSMSIKAINKSISIINAALLRSCNVKREIIFLKVFIRVKFVFF